MSDIECVGAHCLAVTALAFFRRRIARHGGQFGCGEEAVFAALSEVEERKAA